jgi:Holliday junction resolvase RusA-like endonuclease
MVIVSIFIPGACVAKGRARHSTRGGVVRTYTPAKTVSYENLIASRASDAMDGAPPADCALVVSVVAHLPVPASWSAKKRAAALTGLMRPTSRPDVDNYLKSALDGMNAVVFRDDAQIVRATVSKRFAETPGMTIEVRDASA